MCRGGPGVADAGVQRHQNGIAPKGLVELTGEFASGRDRVHRRHDQREPWRGFRWRGTEFAVVGVVVVGGPPGRVQLRRDQEQIGIVGVGVGEHREPPEAGLADLVESLAGESALLRPDNQAAVDLLGEWLVDPLDHWAVER